MENISHNATKVMQKVRIVLAKQAENVTMRIKMKYQINERYKVKKKRLTIEETK